MLNVEKKRIMRATDRAIETLINRSSFGDLSEAWGNINPDEEEFNELTKNPNIYTLFNGSNVNGNHLIVPYNARWLFSDSPNKVIGFRRFNVYSYEGMCGFLIYVNLPKEIKCISKTYNIPETTEDMIFRLRVLIYIAKNDTIEDIKIKLNEAFKSLALYDYATLFLFDDDVPVEERFPNTLVKIKEINIEASVSEKESIEDLNISITNITFNTIAYRNTDFSDWIYESIPDNLNLLADQDALCNFNVIDETLPKAINMRTEDFDTVSTPKTKNESTNVWSFDFKDVWHSNTKNIYLHTSFSDSNYQYLGLDGDFFNEPSKLYNPPTNDSTFEIWFTRDGYHSLELRTIDFVIELSLISNYRNSLVIKQ